ncbi:aldehyde dehydrogenase family protein [Crassaminicella thermophila]|uniref:Aldehyde dehydrogenase family protein n=1 Tax=Crassaminicella thermophila TaxID=2599308 RepID=A0A5C0SBR3_CRATE|nr:aldehyde dehydrogenase family protein [Crassaminicella thermophila]QEK11601.1 aldehyde dehydrogenase family protein [Crassaminicella thermophila]
MSINAKEYVSNLIERARKAQAIADTFTQEKVDELCTAIAWNIVKPENAEKIAEMAVEESGLGNYEGKYAKLMTKIRGGLRDMKGQKSVGVIERDDEKKIIKIAKPVGVVAALVPCTNPEATPVLKSMFAIKGRNAIILAPHPRTKKTNTYIVNIMRETLKKFGAPEDLIIPVEPEYVSMDVSGELMKQADLVLATGGGGMVKAAYSSGTPAYGVGQGNAVTVVDETVDLKETANKIMRSKTFDFATSCSTENSCVVQEDIYDDFVKAMEAEGGYLVSPEEKEKLQKAMWHDGHLSSAIVAQAPEVIAKEAGIELPEGKTFFMVEETGIGPDYPFSGEKLSVVTTLFKYKEFEEAIEKVNAITSYHGRGHSCGIHSNNEDRILALALNTKTSRVMVRQPQCLANSGAWTNGMPMTLTLGCGTWGGNIASENITWKHLINVTWVSAPIESTQPTDEELFGDIMNK